MVIRFASILESLYRMDSMISLKSTGNYIEFSKKLGISKSTLYLYLDILRERGAKISYNRSRQTFEYEENQKLYFGYLDGDRSQQSIDK